MLELHGGTAGWAGLSDTRQIVKRVWEAEKALDGIVDVDTALAFARKNYHARDDDELDWSGFADFFAVRQSINTMTMLERDGPETKRAERNNNMSGRRGGFDSGPREMHKATCAECKQECEVPFKPDGTRPVYCRDCFQKHKPARSSRF